MAMFSRPKCIILSYSQFPLVCLNFRTLGSHLNPLALVSNSRTLKERLVRQGSQSITLHKIFPKKSNDYDSLADIQYTSPQVLLAIAVLPRVRRKLCGHT